MKISLALGVIAFIRLAVYGKHAVTGQASKHIHCMYKIDISIFLGQQLTWVQYTLLGLTITVSRKGNNTVQMCSCLLRRVMTVYLSTTNKTTPLAVPSLHPLYILTTICTKWLEKSFCRVLQKKHDWAPEPH